MAILLYLHIPYENTSGKGFINGALQDRDSWHEAVGQLLIPPQFMEYTHVAHTQRTLE